MTSYEQAECMMVKLDRGLPVAITEENRCVPSHGPPPVRLEVFWSRSLTLDENVQTPWPLIPGPWPLIPSPQFPAPSP